MLAICLTGLAVFAVKTTAQEKLPLRLVVTTPMPGFTGDFDHFGLDLKGNRLFLAAEDQKTVEVFDLRTGRRIHSIEGFGHPLTMAYLSESDRLIVTNGDTDDLTLVDCKEYKIINTLKLGKGVDQMQRPMRLPSSTPDLSKSSVKSQDFQVTRMRGWSLTAPARKCM
jgi:WD40 repeat protein